MSTKTSGSQKLIVQEEIPTFIKRNHELGALLKDLTKISPEALKVIQDIMQSTNDEKLKLQCAEKLLQFQVQVASVVNQDNLQRTVAEIKFKLAPAGKGSTENQPQVDFTTVRTIE